MKIHYKTTEDLCVKLQEDVNIILTDIRKFMHYNEETEEVLKIHFDVDLVLENMNAKSQRARHEEFVAQTVSDHTEHVYNPDLYSFRTPMQNTPSVNRFNKAAKLFFR